MKRFLTVITAVLTSCSPMGVSTDYGGSGDFIIQNMSAVSIRVEFTTVPQLGGAVDTSQLILPYSCDTIFSDAIIGRNVTPATSLSSMKINKDSLGILILIYSQDPIDESKWKIEKKYSGDFGHTDNTFKFTD